MILGGKTGDIGGPPIRRCLQVTSRGMDMNIVKLIWDIRGNKQKTF